MTAQPAVGIKPERKKLDWKRGLLYAVVLALAVKGVYDIGYQLIVNPVPISEITRIYVNRDNGIPSIDIRNIEIGEIKTGNHGSMEVDIVGDVIVPLEDNQP